MATSVNESGDVGRRCSAQLRRVRFEYGRKMSGARGADGRGVAPPMLMEGSNGMVDWEGRAERRRPWDAVTAVNGLS